MPSGYVGNRTQAGTSRSLPPPSPRRGPFGDSAEMLCAQVTWMFEQTVGQFGVSGRISYQADIVSGAVTLIANREGPRYLDRETIERVATDYGDLKAYFELFGYEVTAQIRILGGLRPFFAVRSARALRSWRNADYVERITIRMRAA